MEEPPVDVRAVLADDALINSIAAGHAPGGERVVVLLVAWRAELLRTEEEEQ